MALTDKINAIANSIRSRTGKKDKMTLADMPKEINDIGALLKPTEYPDYVRQEVIRVAEEVRPVLQDDSFVSICMSDTHYPGKENGEGIIHGMMAVKGLTQVLPVDFIAHLGDLSNEQERDTMSYIEDFHYEILSYIKEFGSNSIPLFVAIGNHDCGSYITSDNISDQFSGDWLYDHFTSLSDSSDTVFSGQSTGGYCYRDFPNKKIRVFLLNTSENIITGGNSNDSGTSETQRAWVASKLQELNDKTDAGDWGFIVLCHYPLDYGSSKTLSQLFEAYVGGTSITLKGTTYNFRSKNSAKFLVQFHGHVHNFLYDKIYGGATGNRLNGTSGPQYNAYRVGIPNGQYNRENYYYFTGTAEEEAQSDGTLWGIKFFQGSYEKRGEDEAQHKTPGTAKDTSLVVNVINPSEEKIYSFVYGAGYNRVISIGDKEIYSVNKFLTNVTITDNGTSGIEKNGMYYGTVTIPEDYYMESISIVMNNTDITSDVFNNGIIQIEPVTGSITIKAIAKKIPTSNLDLIAYDFIAGGTTQIFNNGIGYKNDYRLGGNDSPTDGFAFEQAPGYVVTGLIAWDRVTPINIFCDQTIDFNDNKVRMTTIRGLDLAGRDFTRQDTNPLSNYFTITSITDGKKSGIKLTPSPIDSEHNIHSDVTHFYFCINGSGESLIVTFGDDMGNGEKEFSFTYEAQGINFSNKINTLKSGNNYTTVLTPALNGWYVDKVTVLMSDVDVTKKYYNSKTKTINILLVTGNVTIKAKSGSSTANLLQSSTTDALGTTPLVDENNGTKGYLVGKRISTSSPLTIKDDSAYCTSGYIQINPNSTITIKNVDMGNSSTNEYGGLFFYDETHLIQHVKWNDGNSNVKLNDYIFGNTVIYPASNIGSDAITCFRLVAKTITDNTTVNRNE